MPLEVDMSWIKAGNGCFPEGLAWKVDVGMMGHDIDASQSSVVLNEHGILGPSHSASTK